MKWKCLTAFGLALTIAVASAQAQRFSESPSDEGEIQWVMNYDQALEQAKVSGKPILLTFRCVP